MRKIAALSRFLIGSAVVVALALGGFSYFTEAEAAGRCICPMIYAPVKCDNGRIYSNSCFASCAHATNCVPIGPGPIEI
jgi:hypothetical protein